MVVNGWDEPAAGLTTDTADAAAAAGVTLDQDRQAALEAARAFRLRRHRLAAEQVDRLARELPLPLLRLPQVQSAAIGPAELELLAGALSAAVGGLTPHPVGA